MSFSPGYPTYRDAFRGQRMPFAYVDLDLFDENARRIARRAGGKRIRIASKSVRSVDLLRRALAADPVFQGVMCYHPQEAAFLAGEGFDDLLVAYPCWHEEDVGAMCAAVKSGKTVVAMVDSREHVERLDAIAARHGCVLPLCIDVDMSSSFPGVHFGVRRSGLTTGAQAVELFGIVRKHANVRLDGVMGYEAQIAGVPDTAGPAPLQAVVRALKARSVKEIEKRRAEVVDALRAEGATLRFVNGGGTGSLETTTRESRVTEATVGSGFYSPGLFDHYRAFRHFPAAGFALEITRRPAPGIYTCAGGGYPASGSAEKIKLPVPYLPAGAKLIDQEGAGEVQTPVLYDGPEPLRHGDPVFFRHAKAGELCERFDSLLLLSSGRVTGRAPTYRGMGRCFL